jgi:hypothetical protein
LPDGTYVFKPKSQFGKILEGIAKECVSIFYEYLVYYIANWYILWTCFVVIWYIFPHFGIMCQEKSGNPDRRAK